MDSRKESMRKILSYIEAHLEESVDLEQVARVAGYSKYHVNRMFAAQTGCTIHKYIQMRRLTRAAEKLVQTDKTIVEISGEAGYSTQQAFTAAFRSVYLCSPGAYRRRGYFVPKQSRFTLRGYGICGGYGRAA